MNGVFRCIQRGRPGFRSDVCVPRQGTRRLAVKLFREFSFDTLELFCTPRVQIVALRNADGLRAGLAFVHTIQRKGVHRCHSGEFSTLPV